MKLLEFILKTPLRILISVINISVIRYFFGYKSSFKLIDSIVNNKKVFILGSGFSVNSITNDQWNDISNNISIGLNYWLIHDFIPNIIQLEFLSDDKKQYSDLILKVLKNRKEEFINTLFIVKSTHLLWWQYANLTFLLKEIPSELKSNFIFDYDFPHIGNSIQSFSKEINFLKSFNFFSKKTLFNYDVRASLGYSICFLIKRNIKQIILCGVELNNGNYFYEKDLNYYNSKFDINLKKSNLSIHLTNDPVLAELTISYVIYYFNKNNKTNPNNLITLISKESTLYPSLNIYSI